MTAPENEKAAGDNSPTAFQERCYLVAIASAITAAGATAAAARTGFHRLGFVDRQVTAVVVLAMEFLDGALAFLGAAHGHETEAARAVCFTIHDEVGFFDSSALREKLVEVLFGGLEGKISYVQFHTVILFSVFGCDLAPTIEERAGHA
jgi:hypothetical protein